MNIQDDFQKELERIQSFLKIAQAAPATQSEQTANAMQNQLGGKPLDEELKALSKSLIVNLVRTSGVDVNQFAKDTNTDPTQLKAPADFGGEAEGGLGMKEMVSLGTLLKYLNENHISYQGLPIAMTEADIQKQFAGQGDSDHVKNLISNFKDGANIAMYNTTIATQPKPTPKQILDENGELPKLH